MHHVPPLQWGGFVREMHRILRPNGLAMVFEHNPLNPLTRWVVNRCEFDKDAVLLQARRIRGLFRAAKFESVESRSILTLPVESRILRRVDRLLSWLPFGAQYYVAGTKA